MARIAEFSFVGEQKLFRKLAKMERSFQNKAIKKAMRTGAKPLRKKMRATAAKSSGLLKIAIATKIKFYKRTQTVAAIVGARKNVTGKKAAAILGGGEAREKQKPINYIHLVEGASKAHAIAPKEKKALTIGGESVRPSAAHPGTTGTDFIRKAVAATKSATTRAIVTSLRDSIRKELRGA